MATVPNLLLSQFMLGVKGTDYEKVKTAYESLWRQAGHRGNKAAEIEHLALLVDALEFGVVSEENKRLKERLEMLKVFLTGIKN
jgi:hypothetical protein